MWHRRKSQLSVKRWNKLILHLLSSPVFLVYSEESLCQRNCPARGFHKSQEPNWGCPFHERFLRDTLCKKKTFEEIEEIEEISLYYHIGPY